MIELQGVDRRERYAKTINIISNSDQKNESTHVLDVGAGRASPLKCTKSHVISLDAKVKSGIDIVASIACLPFRSQVFDWVTAIDVLEHLKHDEREKAVKEIKRCGRKVLVHTPLQGGKFHGRVGDIRLYNFARKNTENELSKNTLEHITYGEPSLSELEEDGFKLVEPDFNLTIWLTVMKTAHKFRSLANPIFMLLYLLCLRYVKSPPYWGGYLLFDNELGIYKG